MEVEVVELVVEFEVWFFFCCIEVVFCDVFGVIVIKECWVDEIEWDVEWVDLAGVHCLCVVDCLFGGE